MTTRGEFAQELYNTLGLAGTTTAPVFSDATGRMAPIVNALSDLGITKGIGGGQFGTTRDITRGEAFTMLARAYGLAGIEDDVATASQKLVDAGIVKGYGDGSGLGLDDVLNPDHIGHLFSRVADGGFTAPSNDDLMSAEGSRLDTQATADPEFAAALRGFGLSEEQIRATHDFQTTALQNRLATLGDHYDMQKRDSARNINAGAESRGMFRSGHRLDQLAESDADIGYHEQAARDSLTHEIDALGLGMAQDLARIQRDRAEAEAAARGRLSGQVFGQTVTEYEASQT